MSNDRAVLLRHDKMPLDDDVLVEMVAWFLPEPVKGSTHRYKYRFALVADGTCVLRYDNEAGKGDHRHLGWREFAYRFVDLDDLAADFWEDVSEWMKAHREG